MGRTEGLSPAAIEAVTGIQDTLDRVPLDELPQVMEAAFRELGSSTLELVREHGDDPTVKDLVRTAGQVSTRIASADIHRSTAS